MGAQTVRLHKTLAANLTHVRRFACVDPPVHFEVGAPVEAPAADVARVTLVPRVDRYVSLQFRTEGESLRTHRTHVLTYGQVSLLMVSQGAGATKSRTALLTDVITTIRMTRFVRS